MKKELFEYTKEEAQAFLTQDDIKELDYVQDDKYKLFGESVQANVKLRLYEDDTYKVEIRVPDQIQCVPCGIQYKTENSDECPVCETTTRNIMLRNKVFEEPFRKFEGIYSRYLTAMLKKAQPLCALISDNFGLDQAKTAYEAAKTECEEISKELEEFAWVNESGIFDKIVEAKKSKDNVIVMRELTGGEVSEEALLEFKR